LDIIVESERDKRTLEWLISQVGLVVVEQACIELAGQRKPYVSNLAKVLGLEPPESVRVTPKEVARTRLSVLKDVLKSKAPKA
jgi:hypothetical protein